MITLTAMKRVGTLLLPDSVPNSDCYRPAEIATVAVGSKSCAGPGGRDHPVVGALQGHRWICDDSMTDVTRAEVASMRSSSMISRSCSRASFLGNNRSTAIRHVARTTSFPTSFCPSPFTDRAAELVLGALQCDGFCKANVVETGRLHSPALPRTRPLRPIPVLVGFVLGDRSPEDPKSGKESQGHATRCHFWVRRRSLLLRRS